MAGFLFNFPHPLFESSKQFLGAAILAGIGVGLYRDEEDALERVYRPGKTYEPDPERSARYAEWISIYRDLYPAVCPVSHRLFEEFLT